MNDLDLSELIPGYALGALSDAERVRVEAALKSSEAARAELRSYQDLLAGIATAVPQRKAPDSLKDSFRQRLAAEAGSPPATAPSVSPVIPIKPIRSTVPMRRLLIALAAMLIVVVGFLGAYQAITNNQRTQTIQAILNNPAAKRVELTPAPGQAGMISFISVPGDNQGVVVAQLPLLGNDKAYQLWFMKDSNPVSSVVLDATTSQQILANIPQTGTDVALGVTVEKAGGNDHPTTPVLYTGQLQRRG